MRKRIPLTWKLFIIFNYLLLICFLLICVSLCFFIATKEISREDGITFYPFFIGSLITLAHTVFSIILFHRFFPDKPLSRNLRLLFFIGTVLYFLSLIALIADIGYTFSRDLANGHLGQVDIIMNLVLLFLFAMGLYNFFLQVRMSRVIDRNQRATVNHLIDKIGEDR